MLFSFGAGEVSLVLSKLNISFVYGSATGFNDDEFVGA